MSDSKSLSNAEMAKELEATAGMASFLLVAASRIMAGEDALNRQELYGFGELSAIVNDRLMRLVDAAADAHAGCTFEEVQRQFAKAGEVDRHA